MNYYIILEAMKTTVMNELVLSLGDEAESAAILGQRDANLLLIEKALPSKIMVRGNEVHIRGTEEEREHARRVFEHLKTLAAANVEINTNVINYALASATEGKEGVAKELTGNIYVTPRGKTNQSPYFGAEKICGCFASS